MLFQWVIYNQMRVFSVNGYITQGYIKYMYTVSGLNIEYEYRWLKYWLLNINITIGVNIIICLFLENASAPLEKQM